MGKIRSTLTESSRQLYQVDAVIEDVLQNWARWSRPRAGMNRQVNVIAKWAKANRRADVAETDEAPAAYAGTPDPDAAWRAEKVLCSTAFWPPARELIRQHYLYREKPSRTAWRMAFPARDYDFELWRAASMFWTAYSRVTAS